MEYDPRGKRELVVPIMKGKVYKQAGLKNSSFPNVEGALYDKLCNLSRNKLRDEVREFASEIASSQVQNEDFIPSIKWLDDFMERFCLTHKKPPTNSLAIIPKVKGSKNKHLVEKANSSKQNGKDSPQENGKDNFSPESSKDFSTTSDIALSSDSPKEELNNSSINLDTVTMNSSIDPLTLSATCGSTKNSISTKEAKLCSTDLDSTIVEDRDDSEPISDNSLIKVDSFIHCEESNMLKIDGENTKDDDSSKSIVDKVSHSSTNQQNNSENETAHHLANSHKLNEGKQMSCDEHEATCCPELENEDETCSQSKKADCSGNEDEENATLEPRIAKESKVKYLSKSIKSNEDKIKQASKRESFTHSSSDDSEQEVKVTNTENKKDFSSEKKNKENKISSDSNDSEEGDNPKEKRKFTMKGKIKQSDIKKEQATKAKQSISARKLSNSSNLDSDSEEEKEVSKVSKNRKKGKRIRFKQKETKEGKCTKEITRSVCNDESSISKSKALREESTADSSSSDEEKESKLQKSKKDHKVFKGESDSEMEQEETRKRKHHDSENEQDAKLKMSDESDMKAASSDDESERCKAIEIFSIGSDSSEESEEEISLQGEAIEYSLKEDKYYQQNQKRLQGQIGTKLNRCTACYDQVNYLEESMVFTHPVLGVLVCKKCRKFYGKGNFQKDSDGYDNYCRWCANGGEMLLCDCCTNGFCKKCVKRNLGRAAETQALKAKEWKCYVCCKMPLLELRAIQRIILEGLNGKKAKRSRRAQKTTLKKKLLVSKQKHIDRKLNWIDKSIQNLENLLTECSEQVAKIKGKRDVKTLTVDINRQSIRRLSKLCDAMKGNFSLLSKLIQKDVKKFPPETLCMSDENPTKAATCQSSEVESGQEETEIGTRNLIKKPTSHSESDAESIKLPSKKKEKSASQLKKNQTTEETLEEPLEGDSSDDDEEEAKEEIEKKTKRGRESGSGEDVKEHASKKKKDLSGDEKEHTSNPPSEDEDEKVPLKETTSGENSDGEAPKFSEEKKENLFSGFSSDEDTEVSQKLNDLIEKVSGTDDEVKIESGSSSNDLFKERKSKVSQKEPQDSSESSREAKDKNKFAFDTLLAEDSEEESSRRKSSDENNSGLKRKKVDANSDKCEKKGDKNDDALKSLLNSESEMSDIDLDKLKVKKIKRKKPCPRSKSEYYSEEEELSKCKVSIERFPPRIQRLLKRGFIDLATHPYLLKKRKKHFREKKVKSSEDSDEEFSSVLKFKVEFNHRNTASDSCQEESDDSKSASDKEIDLEKRKKVDREEREKKKKEGLMDISLDKDDREEEDTPEEKDERAAPLEKPPTEEEQLNDEMKKALLMSSDEDGEDADVEDEEEEEDEDVKRRSKEKDEKTAEEIDKKRREKYEKQKLLEEEKKKEEEKEEENGNKKSSGESSSSDSDVDGKGKRGRKGFLSLKFSSSSDEDTEEESPRKTRMFVDSDSDFESDQEKKDGKKKKKRSLLDSTDEESPSPLEESSEEEKPKPKRKRIKRPSTSSEEDNKENEDNENLSPSKKRRRHIIRDEDLTESTKTATQQEEERRKRVTQRQKVYNKIFEIDVESDQKDLDKLVLDFNPDTKKELIYVNKKLLEHLKPHQVKGIKFMYDTTIESLDRIDDGHKGTGCILAHCMGLGKTLQVITFIHSLLTNDLMNGHIRRVLVCCPVNTVYNWVSEFKNWLKGKLLAFDVIELISAKDLWHRAYRLDDWYKEGGVCIIGYDMFRNLSNEKQKRYKGKMKDIFQKSLVDPGPDLMVCDEGHVLKNEKTALSIAINTVKTARRIVLTGTPLQNNLKEYHCMIQFVKPNLLGTKKEFFNRFVNPIEAGQCVDALPRDVKRMKRRAHILHNLLEGCVQRFDYTVLKPFLPPKFEYVINIQMSEIQCKLYRYYLENLAQGGPKRSGSGLFLDFTHLQQIWNHPRMLLLGLQKNLYKDEEDDAMSDFICDDSETTESSEDDKKKKKSKNAKASDSDKEDSEKSQPEEEESVPGLTSSGKVKSDWFRNILQQEGGESEEGEEKEFDEEEFISRMEIGGKIVLLLDILRECQSIGDKLLVFSQSLLTLNMIEDFLALLDSGEIQLESKENEFPLHFKHWKPDRDYMRLDGSVNADIRKVQCKRFNNKEDERCRLFLISTRAGGIGINLIGANRVIIFDSSWNPSHDTQSIFRIYRFGQAKPCYVYRFVAQGTMEEKIYSRQVTKISTSLRVVDEHQIKRYFNMGQLAELYQFNPSDPEKRETPNVPEDRLLAEMLIKHKKWIVSFHEHDSLLENQTEEELNEEERKAAWEDFENEKKGLVPHMGRQYVAGYSFDPSYMISLPSYDPQGLLDQIRAQNTTASPQLLRQSVLLATQQIQKAHLVQYQKLQANLYNLKNPMVAPELLRSMPFNSLMDAVAHHERHLQAYEGCIQSENAIISQISRYGPVPKSTMVSAGLMRGSPSSHSSNDTANYVSRSYKMIAPAASTSTGISDSTESSYKIKLPLRKPYTSDKDSKDKGDSSEVVTLE